MDRIKIICPSCNGVERPLIPHSLCGGTGLINGQTDPICSGTGQVQDDVCGNCNGDYVIDYAELPSGLEDKLNDILDKCNDIWEKLNE